LPPVRLDGPPSTFHRKEEKVRRGRERERERERDGSREYYTYTA
jgi:hypothetical protein